MFLVHARVHARIPTVLAVEVVVMIHGVGAEVGARLIAEVADRQI